MIAEKRKVFFFLFFFTRCMCTSCGYDSSQNWLAATAAGLPSFLLFSRDRPIVQGIARWLPA